MNIKTKIGLTASGPVYICHGATGALRHILKPVPLQDSPWSNQQVSVYKIVGDQTIPVVVTPEIDKYQTFLPEGATFEVDCPANGTDRDLQLLLRSEFTARPYEIPMKVGHYRRNIHVEGTAPGVVAKGQEFTLKVAVESFYIAGKLLEGVDVEWCVDGVKVDTVPTTAPGISQFTHTFATMGEKKITAVVSNPYNDIPSLQDFPINVVSDESWKDHQWWIKGVEVPQGSPIKLPRGGQSYTVKLIAPEMKGQSVRLQGIEAQRLGIEATPKFDAPVTLDGEGAGEWTFTQTTPISGHLNFVVVSTAAPINLERKCWVMSDNLADEVDKVLVRGVESPVDGVLFWRNAPQTVTVTYKQGSPLHDYPLVLTGTPLTGVQPGNLSVTETSAHTWSVRSHTDSGTFRLELTAAGMTAIVLPDCKVMSLYLEAEVDQVLVDGVVSPPGGVEFVPNVPQIVTVTYRPNSPLPGYPLELVGTRLTGTGDVEVEFTGPHTWTVNYTGNSGTFRLELKGKDMTRSITLPDCKVKTRNLSDLFEVNIDGKPVPATGNVFYRGKAQAVTLVAKTGTSPGDIPVKLTCAIKSNLDPANVTSQPAFGTEVINLRWSVTGQTKSGTFELKFESAGMTPITVVVSKLLSTNLADEADVRINGAAVPVQGNVFLHGKSQPVTLVPKAGSPLAGIPIKLTCAIISGLEPANVVSVPAFGSQQTNYNWSVAGSSNSGTFQLILTGEGMTLPINVPISTLRANSFSGEVTITIDGQPLNEEQIYIADSPRILKMTRRMSIPGPVRLEWVQGNGIVVGDLAISPSLGETSRSDNWDIRGLGDKIGTFQLKLAADGYEPLTLRTFKKATARTYFN